MFSSSLRKTSRTSPLEQAQRLKNGDSAGGRHRLEMAPVLPLTSLIDAFSIIVIYLLIGTQSGGLEINAPARLQLPVASSSTTLEKESPIVRIEKGQYFINDQMVAPQQLGAKLDELKRASGQTEDAEILIQADQAMNYADLDPLLKAGSEAGIQKLKFAVLPTP